jgi:sugar O-acyltransferase (sialic acid O-acetyltransferase NeuD family)
MDKNKISTLSILGAGGHASVVINAALLSENHNRIEVFDEALDRRGYFLDGIRVQQGLPENSLVHIAIGDNKIRKRLGEMLKKEGKTLYYVMHPRAVVAHTSKVADGCFVAANVVIAPNVQIDEGCIINHGAVVDHDCHIGAWTHIAPNATLGGGVRIGKGCLIGAGAVILPKIHIEDEVIVGAGSVVTRSVEAGVTVMGIPAERIR